jgi:hypothetical protein
MKERSKSDGSLIGVSERRGLSSPTRSTPPAIQCHLAIDHVRHVAAPAQELHYFLV